MFRKALDDRSGQQFTSDCVTIFVMGDEHSAVLLYVVWCLIDQDIFLLGWYGISKS